MTAQRITPMIAEIAGKVERIAHMMRKLLADLPFCDPDIKDLEQAAAALHLAASQSLELELAQKRIEDLKGVLREVSVDARKISRELEQGASKKGCAARLDAVSENARNALTAGAR